MTKTRKARKSPIESATSLPEGTIKKGWVIKKASNGVPRWIPDTSVELNGFKLFTVDYAAKHIGESITLYCREYDDMWPKRNAWSKTEGTYYKLKFVPDGDATKEKTKIEGWLKTQKPAIKKGSHFYINGPVSDGLNGVQVNSRNGKTLSVDFMNTEVFVKV